MAEPTFDVVSEVNLPEVANAVSQARKEVAQRFDTVGVGDANGVRRDDWHVTRPSLLWQKLVGEQIAGLQLLR